MLVGKESINVVVCGPKGSGKSSIISAFITGHFPESVQSTMPEVSIPPDDEDGIQARNHPPPPPQPTPPKKAKKKIVSTYHKLLYNGDHQQREPELVGLGVG